MTAATACPAIADSKGLKDDGVITGPTGSYRVCTLPSIIAKSIILSKPATGTGLVYQMNGRVDVGCDGGFSAPTTSAPRARRPPAARPPTASRSTVRASSQRTRLSL